MRTKNISSSSAATDDESLRFSIAAPSWARSCCFERSVAARRLPIGRVVNTQHGHSTTATAPELACPVSRLLPFQPVVVVVGRHDTIVSRSQRGSWRAAGPAEQFHTVATDSRHSHKREHRHRKSVRPHTSTCVEGSLHFGPALFTLSFKQQRHSTPLLFNRLGRRTDR